MSYGSAPNPRIRNIGVGILVIGFLAFGAFLLFKNQGGPGDRQPVTPVQGNYGSEMILESSDDDFARKREAPLGGGGDFDGQPLTSDANSNRSGDWQIENGQSRQTGASGSTESMSANGEWPIEKADINPKGGGQSKFSNPQPADESGGDWSIEDAGGKNSPKTEKWGLGD